MYVIIGAELMERRIYKNPPISEAICEIRYSDPAIEWDATKLLKFAERLRDEYPTPIRAIVQLVPVFNPPSAQPSRTIELDGGTPRFQLWSLAKDRMVMIGHAIVSVHTVKTYTRWEDFRGRILAAHSAFCETHNPKGVIRIGTRYVNRILVPERSFELDDYFIGIPKSPENSVLSKISGKLEGQLPNQRQFTISFSTAPGTETSSAFLVDIDVATSRSEPPIGLESFEAELDATRDAQRSIFEAMITDKLRNVFDALAN